MVLMSKLTSVRSVKLYRLEGRREASVNRRLTRVESLLQPQEI